MLNIKQITNKVSDKTLTVTEFIEWKDSLDKAYSKLINMFLIAYVGTFLIMLYFVIIK